MSIYFKLKLNHPSWKQTCRKREACPSSLVTERARYWRNLNYNHLYISSNNSQGSTKRDKQSIQRNKVKEDQWSKRSLWCHRCQWGNLQQLEAVFNLNKRLMPARCRRLDWIHRYMGSRPDQNTLILAVQWPLSQRWRPKASTKAARPSMSSGTWRASWIQR